jgi:GT2 family glycosyltransferase
MKIESPSVAVVILSWNDWKNTAECLESIFQSDYKNYDIIVVDNNSNNIHFEKLLDWCKFKKIRFFPINFGNKILIKKKAKKNLYIYKITQVAKIPFAKNLGVAAGYNKGINFALKKNYDFIIRLDCDFLVTKNFIKGMVETFKNDKTVVAVSPKVYYFIKKKTKIIWWKGLNFTKNYFRFHRTGKGGDRRVLDAGQFRGLISSDSVCGCCVMFNSNALRNAIKNHPKRTMVLDEDFFFGPEDMEISQRLKIHGKILVNLNYHTYHKVSQSIFVSGVRANIYFATIGWLLITKKICNKQDQIITRLYFILRGLINILKLFYKKDKNPHIGFLLGLKDYFIKF